MSEQRQAFDLKAASAKEDGESDTDVPPEHGGPEQGGGKAAKLSLHPMADGDDQVIT